MAKREHLSAAQAAEEKIGGLDGRLQRAQRVGSGRGWAQLDIRLVELILAHGSACQSRKLAMSCAAFRDHVHAIQPVAYNLDHWFVRDLLQRCDNQARSAGLAVLFPGVGAQFVGMGAKLVNGPQGDIANAVYSRASEVLGYDLLEVCLNGPKEKLDQEIYSFPAVVVTSLAAIACHEKESGVVAGITAGFMIAEYAALVYSGAMSFDTGIALVQLAATSIHSASKDAKGAMVSIVGLSDARIENLINVAKHETAGTANQALDIHFAHYLFPEGRTLSGHQELCRWFADNGKRYGAKYTKMLRVAGAYQCDLMTNAKKAVATKLQDIQINFPVGMQVFSCTTASVYETADDILENLPQQLIKPVLWEQTMDVFIASDIASYIEPGPGLQLITMMKRICRLSDKFVTIMENFTNIRV